MGAVSPQPPEAGPVTIGVDVGQRVDPTAIAVVERERRDAPDGRREWHHTARYLGRLPLGTPYPRVAERLVAVAGGVLEKSGKRPKLYVDATGVGQPVVDELRDHKVRASLWAAYFTHGDRRMPGEGRSVTIGKAWLVSRLQALLQGERLHLPRHDPEAQTLIKELLDYEIRVDQDANDKYGAFKVGTHDDLVTALGLACQEDGQPLQGVLAHSLQPRRGVGAPVMVLNGWQRGLATPGRRR